MKQRTSSWRRGLGAQWLALSLAVGAVAPVWAGSTIHATNRWSWCASAGWMNWRTDSTNGAVIGEYVCSGFIYSPNTGWIDLGDGSPTNGIYYTNVSTNDYGVNHDGQGNLRGYAWCPSSGWISFEWTNAAHADAPRVDLTTGMLSGYAWGDSLGWISLSNLSARLSTTNLVMAADGDGDGIADAWELMQTGNTTTLGGGGADADGDGFSDLEEYYAGTDPTDPADFVRMAETTPLSGTSFILTWASQPGRKYQIYQRNEMTGATAWVDAGLGAIIAGTGTTTSVTVPIGGLTQKFYRVSASRPLQ